MKDALISLSEQVGGPILALDTSTSQTSLALVHGAHGVVEETALAAHSTPSDGLVAAIENMATRNLCPMKAFAAIVVGLGPGSFTGLRVGLATAKGIAMGGNIDLYGVSSMDVLARAASAGPTVVVGDARRGDFYAAMYERTQDGGCHCILAEQILSLSALTQSVRSALAADGECPWHAITVVGDAALQVASLWGAHADPRPPRVAHGILSAATRLRAKQPSHLATVVPNYLRTSSVGR